MVKYSQDGEELPHRGHSPCIMMKCPDPLSFMSLSSQTAKELHLQGTVEHQGKQISKETLERQSPEDSRSLGGGNSPWSFVGQEMRTRLFISRCLKHTPNKDK